MRTKRNWLTVGDLRRFMVTHLDSTDIPEDAPVVIPGPDHSYQKIYREPMVAPAEDHMGMLTEAASEEEGHLLVLVFGE